MAQPRGCSGERSLESSNTTKLVLHLGSMDRAEAGAMVPPVVLHDGTRPETIQLSIKHVSALYLGFLAIDNFR